MTEDWIYLGLLHYPVYNKQKEVVASAITNLDLHDLARLSATYQLRRYYVINPLELQRFLAEKLLLHWLEGPGKEYNWTRTRAFELVRIVANLNTAIEEIKEASGTTPKLIATTARKTPGQIGYAQMKEILKNNPSQSFLILFGTGWGLTREFLENEVDYILEPIQGRGDYNHLSVRGASAIILDRLLAIDRNQKSGQNNSSKGVGK